MRSSFATLLLAGTALALQTGLAAAFDLGVVAYQMSAETHARCAKAAEEAAKQKGWSVTVLNSNGDLPTHAQQITDLTEKHVDAIILCMSKPIQMDAQLAAARTAGVPIISVESGGSPHTLFDIIDNEYEVGAKSAIYLMGKINYEGGILAERFENNVGTRIRGKVLDVVLSENTAVKLVGSHAMGTSQGWASDIRNGMSALIRQNQGQFKGVWAAYDGQAFIIDDLLKEQGFKKGEIALVSTDGGPEAFRRIKDPDSMLQATVAIPFEEMARKAVDSLDRIVVKHEPKDKITEGSYLYMPGELVDAANVDKFLK